MTQNNFPAHATPSILPVERRLPQPDADATALVRMITDPLDGSKELSEWLLNRPHPLASDAKIVRMYRSDGGVDVYSSDGRMFVRTFVPEHVIRFCDEVMSEDTFVEFIAVAEEDEEEEEEEELPPEPEPEPAPTPNPGPSAAS
jgi:hypothetical protein